MTRWARSGNTQQHRKQPCNATPWSELSQSASSSTVRSNNHISSNNGGKNSNGFRNLQRNGRGAEKREKFMDKVKKNREKNGIMLLPAKEERKLYRMKRGLRAKGLPEEKIRETIREMRRKAERTFQRSVKVCFKCRETGHILAECPQLEKDPEQGTGICFKCGSAEHTSRQCHLKASDYPFAKCFICQEQGHLSRNCPKNDHGVFPKGGKCRFCGDKGHMKKDCPMLQKQNNEERGEITVGVADVLGSVDDEIVDNEEEKNLSVNTTKKPKVIKF